MRHHVRRQHETLIAAVRRLPRVGILLLALALSGCTLFFDTNPGPEPAEQADAGDGEGSGGARGGQQ